MFIKQIKLTNFRNHSKYLVEPDPGITVIIGPNASGKTNILESIHYLSTARSFKAKYDRECIKHNEEFTRIEGTVADDNDPEGTRLELFIAKNTDFENTSIKKVKVNKVSKPLQYFSGNLNSVLFSPEDIDILTGSPTGRRKYMDMILLQIGGAYKKAFTEYIKAVRQRNRILEKIRETGSGRGELGFWDTKVVQNGILVQNEREKMLSYLQKKLDIYGKQLNGEDTQLQIQYQKSTISEERLEEYRQKEIMAKSTLIGPHRDDFNITFDGFDIGSFGSRGQQRSTILALKLGEVDFFLDRTGTRPVLLLDDIFSELDIAHEKAVMSVIDLQQTIITATDSSSVELDKALVIELQ